MYRSPSPLRVAACLGATIGLSVLATGCGPSQPAQSYEEDPAMAAKDEKIEVLRLTPEWRKFAETESRYLVMAELGGPQDNSFPEEVKVVATRNHTRGYTQLLAISEIEMRDATGYPVRRPYTVTWFMEGGKWKVSDVMVQGPKPVPPPETRPSRK